MLDTIEWVLIEEFRYINAKTLQVAVRDGFEGVEERFGERLCSYHRVDLHSGLRELAEAAGAKIRLSTEVVDVQPEEGIVEIKGGEKVKKDFWVLADGCHVSQPFPIPPPIEIPATSTVSLPPQNRPRRHPNSQNRQIRL